VHSHHFPCHREGSPSGHPRSDPDASCLHRHPDCRVGLWPPRSDIHRKSLWEPNPFGDTHSVIEALTPVIPAAAPTQPSPVTLRSLRGAGLCARPPSSCHSELDPGCDPDGRKPTAHRRGSRIPSATRTASSKASPPPAGRPRLPRLAARQAPRKSRGAASGPDRAGEALQRHLSKRKRVTRRPSHHRAASQCSRRPRTAPTTSA